MHLSMYCVGGVGYHLLRLKLMTWAAVNLCIWLFGCFPFGFEGRIWGMIVSVPDHCLSFYFPNVMRHRNGVINTPAC